MHILVGGDLASQRCSFEQEQRQFFLSQAVLVAKRQLPWHLVCMPQGFQEISGVVRRAHFCFFC